MKKFLTTLSILLIATASYAQTYTVERVIDGDTIKLTDGETVKLIGIDAPPIVFPEGIDPTLYDPPGEVLEEARKWGDDLGVVTKMGQEATEFVKKLYFEGKEVSLEFDVQSKDKYGRLLAYVFIPSCLPECPALFPGTYHFVKDMGKYWHIFLNATVIKAGYATPMTIPPNVKYADLFKKLYEEAREQKRGLWKKSKDSSQLTKDEVKRIAEEYAVKEGVKLERWVEPKITYIEQDGEWSVNYHGRKSTETGEMYLHSGGIYINVDAYERKVNDFKVEDYGPKENKRGLWR